ncbi:hypothetical protein [Crocosphaera sp.]|uniref:hypothetical protein n=1 Tax=Crocosphaera sp. TaxID=2729996 RepID=UPI003F1FDE95|nr:hypothetical protein [Crocosphaera sp.]
MPEPFRFSSGHLAYTVQDLVGVCHQSPQEVIYYLKRGDFEKWLAYIGETAIAQKVEEVSKLSVTDEELLKQFIKVLEPPEPEKSSPTSSPEKTISDSPATISPSNQDTSKTEVDNIDPNDKTAESEETSPMTQLKEKTLDKTEAKKMTETPDTSEVKEPTTEVTETESKTSTETPEISEVKEPATEKTEAKTSTETPATPKVEETTDKEAETEAKKAIASPAEPEVTEEPKEPVAPLNEYSDEGVEAKSSFAKALQGFMSQYITKE